MHLTIDKDTYCKHSNWDGQIFTGSASVVVPMPPTEEDKKDWCYHNRDEKSWGVIADESYTDTDGWLVHDLNNDVYKWLNDLLDVKSEPAWCIGNVFQRKLDQTGIEIYFKRQRDAYKFVRAWSPYSGKATSKSIGDRNWDMDFSTEKLVEVWEDDDDYCW